MDYIEYQITNSIIEHNNNSESSFSALIHWRWSKLERVRRSLIRQEFKELEITNTEEYSILVYISLNPHANSKGISNYLNMEKSTVSEFIKRCMDRNLIEEILSESDKRVKYYSLTPKGKVVLDKAHYCMESVNNKLFGSLNKKEKQSILKILVELNKLQF